MESKLILKDKPITGYHILMTQYTGFYQLGGNRGLRISQEKKPCWFHRKMMKWCLGLEWFDGPAV
jgi:hypothetical protein